MNLRNTFYEDLLFQGRSQLTLKGYQLDHDQFAGWFEKKDKETFSVTTITPLDIRAYRQYLIKDRRLKPTTINRKLSAISSLMAWAKNAGHIEFDPTTGIRKVEQVESGPRWLDKKQQFAFLRAIEKDLQLSKLRYPKRWLTRRRDA